MLWVVGDVGDSDSEVMAMMIVIGNYTDGDEVVKVWYDGC